MKRKERTDQPALSPRQLRRPPLEIQPFYQTRLFGHCVLRALGGSTLQNGEVRSGEAANSPCPMTTVPRECGWGWRLRHIHPPPPPTQLPRFTRDPHLARWHACLLANTTIRPGSSSLLSGSLGTHFQPHFFPAELSFDCARNSILTARAGSPQPPAHPLPKTKQNNRPQTWRPSRRWIRT